MNSAADTKLLCYIRFNKKLGGWEEIKACLCGDHALGWSVPKGHCFTHCLLSHRTAKLLRKDVHLSHTKFKCSIVTFMTNGVCACAYATRSKRKNSVEARESALVQNVILYGVGLGEVY